MTHQQRWFGLPVLGSRQPVVGLPSPRRPVDEVVRSVPGGTRGRTVALLVAGAALVGALVVDTTGVHAEPSATTATPVAAGARVPRAGLPVQGPASAAEVAFLQAYIRAGLPVAHRGAALELGRTICRDTRTRAAGAGRAPADLSPSEVERVIELARTSLCPAVPTG